jgi:hypothetical protein
VIVDVLVPFAVMDVGDAVIVDCARLGAPAVNVTVAVAVTALPLRVPEIVALPATVGDVNIAEYIPLLLSVTLPRVPAVVPSATVPPLAVRLLPFASFSCTVIVDVLVPFAVMDVGDAVIVDCARLAAPAVKVTVAVAVIALPLSVPEIVALPASVGDVNVAVYVPLLLSVTLPRDPAVVPSAIVPPLAVRLLPFASFNCTVIVDVLAPFAVIDVGDAVIVDCARLGAPAVNVTVA